MAEKGEEYEERKRKKIFNISRKMLSLEERKKEDEKEFSFHALKVNVVVWNFSPIQQRKIPPETLMN